MHNALYAIVRSVCPSVCLSHACIVSKQQSSSSSNLHWIVAYRDSSLRTPNLERISLGVLNRREVLNSCDVTLGLTHSQTKLACLHYTAGQPLRQCAWLASRGLSATAELLVLM